MGKLLSKILKEYITARQEEFSGHFLANYIRRECTKSIANILKIERITKLKVLLDKEDGLEFHG